MNAIGLSYTISGLLLLPFGINSTLVPNITANSSDLSIFHDINAIITYNITTNGIACCNIEQNPNMSIALNANDVYLGFSRNGNVAFSNFCLNVPLGSIFNYTWTFFQNYSYDIYQITCTACNLYPVTPLCLADNLLEYQLNWVRADISAASELVLLSSFLIIIFY